VKMSFRLWLSMVIWPLPDKFQSGNTWDNIRTTLFFQQLINDNLLISCLMRIAGIRLFHGTDSATGRIFPLKNLLPLTAKSAMKEAMSEGDTGALNPGNAF